MISSTTAVRRVVAAAALVSGTAVLAACSSSGGTGAAGPSTVTPTVTSTPAASASLATSSAATASSTPAGPAACATSQLGAGLGQGNGAAGSTIVPVQFTNTSGTACSLYGYPGVSFVTGEGGSQIGASAGEDSATPRTVVTLAPGARAHALLQVVVAQNFPAGKCKLVTAHWLKVFPPGQTAALYVKYTSATCSSPSTSVRVLNVQTVAPGDGNS
jgi:hypothetical protein